MKFKIIISGISMLLLIMLANTSSAQTVNEYSGEYATELTVFEYELTTVTDPSGVLKFFWGFNTTGDIIRFEIGSSVLSEDYIDVYYDQVYKIPMDIYLNDVELDVNANETLFDYWEGIFWDRILLPIEDGQYNNFDVLEDQDPANWDVKGAEVSYFTTDSERVYEYNTGILLSWISTVTYDFTLMYIAPPEVSTSETPSESSSEEDEGLLDQVPISTSIVFITLAALLLGRKIIKK